VYNKAFSQQNQLKEYSVAHCTKRPFEYDICHKTYKRSFQLTQHKKSHTSVKNFVCDTCGYAAISRLMLEMHMKRHFKDYRFTCDICGNGYCMYYEFRRHIFQLEKNTSVKSVAKNFLEDIIYAYISRFFTPRSKK
jgi:KRAB domain-containing zinc finger protein